jgi:hypothetical protein
MLISLNWNNSLGRSEQQPIEKGLALRMPMFPMRQCPHFRGQSKLSVSVQDAKRVSAQDARFSAMSFPYTKRSSPDSNLESWGGAIVNRFYLAK